MFTKLVNKLQKKLCHENTVNEYIEENISNLYCVTDQLTSENKNEWWLTGFNNQILIVILIVNLKQ